VGLVKKCRLISLPLHGNPSEWTGFSINQTIVEVRRVEFNSEIRHLMTAGVFWSRSPEAGSPIDPEIEAEIQPDFPKPLAVAQFPIGNRIEI
jgi:hypothetical protein